MAGFVVERSMGTFVLASTAFLLRIIGQYTTTIKARTLWLLGRKRVQEAVTQGSMHKGLTAAVFGTVTPTCQDDDAIQHRILLPRSG